MTGGYRFLYRPRWIGLHLLTIALVVTMVLLGHWQLDVSNEKHFNIQNFGYALQWWIFSGFAVFLWTRLVRDAARGAPRPAESPSPGIEQVAYRRYVPPPREIIKDDPELVAYNDYLAQLAQKDGNGE